MIFSTSSSSVLQSCNYECTVAIDSPFLPTSRELFNASQGYELPGVDCEAVRVPPKVS